MAYQTGTINTISDVNTILDSFLLANGWAKTANSLVVTNCNIGSVASSEVTLTSTNNLTGIPVGAKATWTGQIANYYVTRRISTTQVRVLADAVVGTSYTGVSVTFSWNTYNKGTKYFNFQAFKQGLTTNISYNYIIGDLYHLPTFNNTTLIPSGAPPAVRLTDGNLPCTYDLFANTNPDMVSMCFRLGTNASQHLHLGDLAKINSAAYVGGEFLTFSACTVFSSLAPGVGGNISDINISLAGDVSSTYMNTIAFAQSSNNANNSGVIHAEIDGFTYPNNYNNFDPGTVTLSESSITKWFRGLNNWNSQVTLVVPEIHFVALSSFRSVLGVKPHMRLVRVDNYNTGDEITLGTDVWKVYPVAVKNISLRNVFSSNGGTGTLGFAVRKVV